MVYSVSPLKHAGPVVAGVVLAATGVWLGFDPAGDRSPWVGWGIAAFFAVCAVAGIHGMVRGGRVRIDERGISDSRWRVGTVPWAEIESVSRVALRGASYLSVEVRDEARYLERLPPLSRRLAAANRKLGISPLAVDFTGLAPGLDAAWKQLEAERPGLLRR
ncbi:MAG TPA: STM3941 family protein [Thermoanaerobaculia bacterium]|nr:STM3941 family protein [Thermoanaerobaculia bacterium]